MLQSLWSRSVHIIKFQILKLIFCLDEKKKFFANCRSVQLFSIPLELYFLQSLTFDPSACLCSPKSYQDFTWKLNVVTRRTRTAKNVDVESTQPPKITWLNVTYAGAAVPVSHTHPCRCMKAHTFPVLLTQVSFLFSPLAAFFIEYAYVFCNSLHRGLLHFEPFKPFF